MREIDIMSLHRTMKSNVSITEGQWRTLIDNILLVVNTTVLTVAILWAVFMLYRKGKKTVVDHVEIENLPNNLNTGFGYLKGNTVLLNEDGVPYLYETYPEALSNMPNIKGASKVVYQKWDMSTKMVFIGDIQNGPNKR
jgi:hypothetical protein